MTSINLKELQNKSIDDLVKEKLAIMVNTKNDAEMLIEHFTPDYFEYSYRLKNNKYLLVFVKNWITKESSLLKYDLDASFKYLDKDEYTMELTEKNLIKWLNDKAGYEIEKILVFN